MFNFQVCAENQQIIFHISYETNNLTSKRGYIRHDLLYDGASELIPCMCYEFDAICYITLALVLGGYFRCGH